MEIHLKESHNIKKQRLTYKKLLKNKNERQLKKTGIKNIYLEVNADNGFIDKDFLPIDVFYDISIEVFKKLNILSIYPSKFNKDIVINKKIFQEKKQRSMGNNQKDYLCIFLATYSISTEKSHFLFEINNYKYTEQQNKKIKEYIEMFISCLDKRINDKKLYNELTANLSCDDDYDDDF